VAHLPQFQLVTEFGIGIEFSSLPDVFPAAFTAEESIDQSIAVAFRKTVHGGWLVIGKSRAIAQCLIAGMTFAAFFRRLRIRQSFECGIVRLQALLAYLRTCESLDVMQAARVLAVRADFGDEKAGGHWWGLPSIVILIV
jgi:hypothetical protein